MSRDEEIEAMAEKLLASIDIKTHESRVKMLAHAIRVGRRSMRVDAKEEATKQGILWLADMIARIPI